MVSVVEDIVTHFTLQVDTTKGQKCAFLEGLVKRLVEKSIDFCFKLFFTAIVPELTPVMNYYVTDALQNKYEGWQNKYKAWLESELQAVSPGPMIQLKINLPIIQKEKRCKEIQREILTTQEISQKSKRYNTCTTQGYMVLLEW